MQVDHDITAELDNPHLSGVKVVAAIRQISVAQARVELLTEWDQRLAAAIAAELNQSQMWADLAGDTAPHDPEGASGFIDAASECLTVAARLRYKRAQAADMIRLASTELAD
ncbi:MAG: hypothetical protein DI630_00010 [Gordonia sp. (in: high G+C Gram-positive bacteria)]|nr:MAG: hypothetical protein DI630_00010 [Gordonia sp. (in: high G+C Gram-positive bacteria)]